MTSRIEIIRKSRRVSAMLESIRAAGAGYSPRYKVARALVDTEYPNASPATRHHFAQEAVKAAGKSEGARWVRLPRTDLRQPWFGFVGPITLMCGDLPLFGHTPKAQ